MLRNKNLNFCSLSFNDDCKIENILRLKIEETEQCFISKKVIGPLFTGDEKENENYNKIDKSYQIRIEEAD